MRYLIILFLCCSTLWGQCAHYIVNPTTRGLDCAESAVKTVPWDLVVNAQTGTTYTVLATDHGKNVTHTNAAAIAVTLPQATGSFADGFWYYTKNLGAGTVTITPTTSTIAGGATFALTTGQWALVVSDGTNYNAYGLRLTGGAAITVTDAVAGQTVAVTDDGIGTAKLDDGADTPASGEYVQVDTDDQAGFTYRTDAEVLSDIGAQASDAELAAVAGLSSTGVVVHTGAGTMTERTVTGTTNEITVADGSGVAGNPTISLAAAVPSWHSYTVAYDNAAFVVADTDASATLFTLPANGVITGVRLKHSVAFAGTAVTAVSCSVGDAAGDTADDDAYLLAADVFQAAGDTVQEFDGGAYSTTAAEQTVQLHCTANTNFGDGSSTVLTAGSVKVSVEWAVLP